MYTYHGVIFERYDKAKPKPKNQTSAVYFQNVTASLASELHRHRQVCTGSALKLSPIKNGPNLVPGCILNWLSAHGEQQEVWMLLPVAPRRDQTGRAVSAECIALPLSYFIIHTFTSSFYLSTRLWFS